MWKQAGPYSFLVLLVFVFGAFIAVANLTSGGFEKEHSLEILAPKAPFSLVDPQQAPKEIREEVLLGYRILTDTPRYAPRYTGDTLSCRNCDFEGGNSVGGRNGSISLVGVTHIYPRFSEREGRKISLGERINNCFMRSMNGKALPLKSKEMRAMLAYFSWISSPAKGMKEFPWLGLPKLPGDVTGSADRGQKQYVEHCSACHGESGEGTTLPPSEEVLDIPPLWGSGSFNDGAGMHKETTLAPFILVNMTYRAPVITVQEAKDIAAFIAKQPRPHFKQ